MILTSQLETDSVCAMNGCSQSSPLSRAGKEETSAAVRRRHGKESKPVHSLTNLLEIIELAYAEDNRGHALNPFFTALRQLLPFDSAVLMPVNPDRWQLELGWLWGCTADRVDLYVQQRYRLDPMIACGPAGWSLNRVIHWPDLTSDTDMSWEDFTDRAAQAPLDHALSVLCGYRGHPTALFRLFRSGKQPAFGGGEISTIGNLARHVGRAVYLRQLAERPELALSRGVVVMADDGELLFQSAGCQKIVGRKPSAMANLLAQARTHGLWFSVPLGLGYRVQPIPMDHGSLLASFDPESPEPNVSAASNAQAPRKGRAFALEPIVQRTNLRKRLIGYGLTARELEIGLLVVQGLPYKVIARSLNITEQTVKDHLRNVFKKVGVRSGGALVAHIVGVRHLRFMDSSSGVSAES